MGFVTPKAKLAFAKFRQAYSISTISNHFNLKCHIWIKTHALGYAIGGILS